MTGRNNKLYRPVRNKKKSRLIIIISILAAACIVCVVAGLFATNMINFKRQGSIIAKSETVDLANAKQASYLYMKSDGGRFFNRITGESLNSWRFEGEYKGKQDDVTAYVNSGKLSYTPISDARAQNIVIESDSDIQSIAYELRSVTTGDLIERGEDVSFTSDEKIEASLLFKNLINTGEKYLLEVQTTDSDNTGLYFDTIIEIKGESYLDKKLEFVEHFTDILYDGSAFNEVFSYLAPIAGSDTSNFATANIFSPTSLVTWGDLTPSKAGGITAFISSMDTTSTRIAVSYPINLKGAGGSQKRVVVNEIYAVRAEANGEVSLKNYERRAYETLSENSAYISGSALSLGYQAEASVNSKISANGNYTAFENGGNLWLLDVNRGLSKIFTFAKAGENTDLYPYVYADDKGYYKGQERDFGIKILNVSDEGNVDFIVYGTQLAGDYASVKGMALYSYGKSGDLRQRIFIRSQSKNLAAIAEGAYLSASGDLFIIEDNVMKKISSSNLTKETVIERMQKSEVSGNGRYFAYGVDGKDNSNVFYNIHIYDRESQTDLEVKSPDGNPITLEGFIGNDIVYGVVENEGFGATDGRAYFSKIEIADVSGAAVKTYELADFYFSDIEISEGAVSFKRYKKNEDRFDYQDDNKLLATEVAPVSAAISTGYTSDTVYRKLLSMNLPQNIKSVGDIKSVSGWSVLIPNEVSD